MKYVEYEGKNAIEFGFYIHARNYVRRHYDKKFVIIAEDGETFENQRVWIVQEKEI